MSEVDDPLHTDVGAPDAATVGNAFTATETVVVFVHPKADVPVTVYVVFAVGETETVVPLSEPGIQLYVAAPEPFRLVDDPVQTAGDVALAATVGGAWKLTSTKSVLPEHALVVLVIITW